MRKKLKEAIALKNGIAFYSKSQKGYVLLATIDKSNQIKTEWVTEFELNNRDLKNKDSNLIVKIFFSILLILAIITFFFITTNIILTHDLIFLFRFLFLYLSIFKVLSLVFSYVYNNTCSPHQFLFHSAEHMVINAYEALRRVPTIEEIRKYSRFSNGCSITISTQFAIFYFSLFVCTYITNIYYMLIAMSCFPLILTLMQKYGLLNFLQRFFTKSPTEIELKVAIEGLRTFLEYENASK